MITIRVAELYPICATRERGRQFLHYCASRIQAQQAAEIAFSFDGVEFVSPSFLDEAVLNLIIHDSVEVSTVWLEHLSEHALDSLQILIDARDDANVELQTTTNGHVAASVAV